MALQCHPTPGRVLISIKLEFSASTGFIHKEQNQLYKKAALPTTKS